MTYLGLISVNALSYVDTIIFPYDTPNRVAAKESFATALWINKTSGFSKRKILTLLFFQCYKLNC